MTVWTHERLEQCRDLWNDSGLSAADIAVKMGLGFRGRNSVISVANRYREKYGFVVKATKGSANRRRSQKRKVEHGSDGALARRVAEAHKAAKAKPAEPKKVTPCKVTPQKSAENGSENVTLLQLTSTTCRWPVGVVDGPETLFCGAKAPLDSPYCEHHAARARSQRQPEARTRPARRSA